jgi:thiol:disulfide interchange protein DsbD
MRFLLLLFFSITLFGVSFLQPEEAFKPKIAPVDDHTISVEIVLGDNIYLYKDKLKIEDANLDAGIHFSNITTKTPTVNHEGDAVYEISPLTYITLTKNNNLAGEQTVRVKLSYQGCSLAGLCYEPQSTTLELKVNADKLALSDPAHLNASAVVEPKKTRISPPQGSESDQIANVIKKGSVWFIIISFFGFGILLSLTPCVFPMIPIISSVIIAQGKGIGTRRAFFLSLIYVLSMAVAYTIAGVLAGLFGANLQAAFQTPWIITVFALIFVLLSLSMFDVYELQIPHFIQSRLSHLGGQKSGVVGIAIMGFVSALIVGPCVAAPLAGALIYIGQTGDALLGGVALFALSIGMGVPLLIVGTTSGKFMPKPGMWMDVIKAIFGVILLGIAIWMMGRVLDENTTLLLWGGLAIFVAVNIGALEPLGKHPAWSSKANIKSLGIMILLYGMALLIGGMANATNVLHPLDPFLATKSVIAPQVTKSHQKFETITSLDELDAILEENKGKKILVDFYADWCTACKELEEKTFSDEAVKTAMDPFILVRVDLTANDDSAKAISQKYHIFGPPAILFFNDKGEQIEDSTLIGFKEPKEFLTHLGTIK